MNCKKCGKKIEEKYQYCYKCGDTFGLTVRQRITGEQLTKLSPKEKKVVETINKHPILIVVIMILAIAIFIFIFKV